MTAKFIDPAPFKTKLEGEGEAAATSPRSAGPAQPDLVVLAGFMRVLKPGFLNAFAGKIINLHPSLLPAFPGLDAIGQALRAGVAETGCTVHAVTLEVDGGPVIETQEKRACVDPGDTPEEHSSAKVHARRTPPLLASP